ncbi:aspartate--tRNA ligase dps1 [Chytridiales sp. JEL 0842]|nr:aspartate--tRNA ligase dps1 [Chytridiales sp. JEL 0842]
MLSVATATDRSAAQATSHPLKSSLLPESFRQTITIVLERVKDLTSTPASSQPLQGKRLHGFRHKSNVIWIIERGVRHPLRSICGERPFLLLTKYIKADEVKELENGSDIQENIRSAGGNHDPANHSKTRQLNEELQYLSKWDRLRCGHGDPEADWPIAAHDGSAALTPLVDQVDDFLDRIKEEGCNLIGDEPSSFGNSSSGLTADVDPLGKLTARLDLDFTERFWKFCLGATSLEDLSEVVQIVADDLLTGKLQPMVNKSNNTSLAIFIRDCLKLSRTQTSPDYMERKEAVATQADYWIENPLEYLVEAGIAKLRRDYCHFLIGPNLASWNQLEVLVDPTQSLTIQIRRLERLHKVLEVYTLAISTVFSLPQASGRALVAAALEYYLKESKKDEESEDGVESAEDGADNGSDGKISMYKVCLPRFQAVTSKLLDGISKSFQPTLWRLAISSVAQTKRHVSSTGPTPLWQQTSNQNKDDASSGVIPSLTHIIELDQTDALFNVESPIEDPEKMELLLSSRMASVGLWRIVKAVAESDIQEVKRTKGQRDESNEMADQENVQPTTVAAEGAPATAEVILGEDGKPLSEKALKKRAEKAAKEAAKEARRKEVAEKQAAEKAAREAAAAQDYSEGKYGYLPMNQSQERTGKVRTKFTELSLEKVDQTVLVSGRVHKTNAAGKLCFVTLRQRTVTVQAVLAQDAKNISKQMVKFANEIPTESLVLVEAIVVKPKELVKSCTVQEIELKIQQLHVVSKAAPRLPFLLEDAQRPETDFEADDTLVRVNLDTRLNERVIDLRTITNQAIFKMQSGVGALFREFLDKEGFMEIHSPKIIEAASEGGANVFKVSYFAQNAYLAQSPQLYKQMVICSDFDRVYEIAPVFRAEQSFTHRHMTEFVGLDLEMAFEEHYHEVLDLFDKLFVFIFDGLKTRYANEIATVKRQYPFEDFLYLPQSLRLKYSEGIKMLREAGVKIGDYDDLNTEQEKFLGRLVREKYKTDFYMLDKFPLAVRPFYTMPDPNLPGYSNSYDFFMRGEEILSGAQRIHDPQFLEERAKEHKVEINTIQAYLDAFKYGAPPHAGGGIGLERVVMLYLKLGNIRRTSLFPRDPKRLSP